jgi:hypothetical protein
MRTVTRATLGFLSAGALIGLQMFGCSAADESPEQVEQAAPVEEQNSPTIPETTAPPPDNRLADLAERFKAIDERLDENPKDSRALEELVRLRAEVDARMNVLMTVELGPDHRVKFYEPLPGVPTVHEMFPQGRPVESILEHEEPFESMAAIYKAIRPSEAVPEVLLAADLRASQGLTKFARPSLEEVVEAEPPLVPKISSSCSEFKSAGGCPAPTQSTPWCYCNSVGNRTKTHTTSYSVFNLAPYDGTVSIELYVSGALLAVHSAAQGEYHSMWTRSDEGYGDKYCDCGLWQACGSITCFRTHTAKVVNASGDEYHFGGHYKK